MKYLYTIIVFFIYLNSFGQKLNEIKLKLNLLESNYDFKLDSTGLSELLLPSYRCSENNSENNWHVQDINNDGLKDLIYSGTCQPYYQTAIFLNSKNGFKLVYDYPGKIVSITENSNKINILKSSCCCDYYSDLIEVSVNNKYEIQKNTISFNVETKIETQHKLNFKTVSGILRSTPILENKVKKDVCSDDTIIGNQIETIKNKQAIVLNEKNDWLLVLIERNEVYSIIGWINKQ